MYNRNGAMKKTGMSFSCSGKCLSKCTDMSGSQRSERYKGGVCSQTNKLHSKNLSTQALPTLVIRGGLNIQQIPSIDIPQGNEECCPRPRIVNVGMIDCLHQSVVQERLSRCCNPCRSPQNRMTLFYNRSCSPERGVPQHINYGCPQQQPELTNFNMKKNGFFPNYKFPGDHCPCLEQPPHRSQIESDLFRYLKGNLGDCEQTTCFPQEEVTRDCVQTTAKAKKCDPCCQHRCHKSNDDNQSNACTCGNSKKRWKSPNSFMPECARKPFKLEESPYFSSSKQNKRSYNEGRRPSSCDKKFDSNKQRKAGREFPCECNCPKAEEDEETGGAQCSIVISCSPRTRALQEVKRRLLADKNFSTVRCDCLSDVHAKQKESDSNNSCACFETDVLKSLIESSKQTCSCASSTDENKRSVSLARNLAQGVNRKAGFYSLSPQAPFSDRIQPRSGSPSPLAKIEEQPVRDIPLILKSPPASPRNVTASTIESENQEPQRLKHIVEIDYEDDFEDDSQRSVSQKSDINKNVESSPKNVPFVRENKDLNTVVKAQEVKETPSDKWYSVVTSAWPRAVAEVQLDSTPCLCNAPVAQFPECCYTTPPLSPRLKSYDSQEESTHYPTPVVTPAVTPAHSPSRSPRSDVSTPTISYAGVAENYTIDSREHDANQETSYFPSQDQQETGTICNSPECPANSIFPVIDDAHLTPISEKSESSEEKSNLKEIQPINCIERKCVEVQTTHFTSDDSSILDISLSSEDSKKSNKEKEYSPICKSKESPDKSSSEKKSAKVPSELNKAKKTDFSQSNRSTAAKSTKKQKNTVKAGKSNSQEKKGKCCKGTILQASCPSSNSSSSFDIAITSQSSSSSHLELKRSRSEGEVCSYSLSTGELKSDVCLEKDILNLTSSHCTDEFCFGSSSSKGRFCEGSDSSEGQIHDWFDKTP